MASKQIKKDTTLTSTPIDTTQGSSITYANEVVAIIAGVAASEVEGIAGMCNVGGSGILNKNRNITRGVKVEIGTEEASVDLYVIVEYGTPIQKAAHDAQEGVRKAIESMTGLHVVRVDVHVQGVSFEKENSSTLMAGQEQAALSGTAIDEPEEKPVAQAPAATVTGPETTGATMATEAAAETDVEAAVVAEGAEAEADMQAEADAARTAAEEITEEISEEIPVEISFDHDDEVEAAESADETADVAETVEATESEAAGNAGETTETETEPAAEE